jgi:predicted nuclease of predicted toxin-antitoxin system
MVYKPKFFTDTHIAKAVAIQLRDQGIDVVRSEEVGMATASDLELLAYASQEGRVLLSCDDDFRTLHFTWMAQGKSHTGIIKLDQEKHCQNIGRIVKLVALFHALVDDPVDCYNRYYEGGVFE